MRHEASFLKDILNASSKIEAITAATSEESFLRDEVLPAAVLHHLTVMGEAINLADPLGGFGEGLEIAQNSVLNQLRPAKSILTVLAIPIDAPDAIEDVIDVEAVVLHKGIAS